MGKLVKKVPKAEYDYEIDWSKLLIVFWVGLCSLIVAGFLLVWAFKGIDWTLKSPPPPPKVITKTVYRDAFTATQAHYVQDCESAEQSINGLIVNGVPDIHGQNWSCTYPVNNK